MGGIFGTISLLCLIALSSLNIGEPAPSLEGTHWIKGKAYDFKKQVTIVEFWRTTCGSCRSQIPHLTSLQHTYGDRLSVITVSRDSVEKLEEYIKANGDQMDFAVGSVTKEVGDTYMSGVPGVPYAFIINRDGLIVWKGHPSKIDDILSKTIDGMIDMEQLKKIDRLETSLNDALETNDPNIIAPADSNLLAADPGNELGLEIGMRLAIYNEEPGMVKEMFDNINFTGLSSRNANIFAKMLVTESDLEYRYPDAAFRFSVHALKQDPENGSYMDVFARVLYCLADLDNAIIWEKKAISLNPDNSSFQKNLDYYLSLKATRGNKDYNAYFQLRESKTVK
ncbi:MAG: redoxin domain-containing protein [Deltaproteobacteria bacterium]|nr:redoxin domain-containing protein [Deltaproteobacteria bacterium]